MGGTSPTWSPDGKTLLFTIKVGKYERILKMDADSGRNLIELSSIAANELSAKLLKPLVTIWSYSNHSFYVSRNGRGFPVR